MSELDQKVPGGRVRIRWWPAVAIVALVVLRVARVLGGEDTPRQQQVMQVGSALIGGVGLLMLWWMFFSRAPGRWRWYGLAGAVVAVGLGVAAFRYEGVTGDLVPILEPRWKPRARAAVMDEGEGGGGGVAGSGTGSAASFPQFLGPERTGELRGVGLDPDWAARAPGLVWRQPVGSGWGGFAVADGLALTQEQDGAFEVVTAREWMSGRLRWEHRVEARYDNPIGGVGPRATPTVHGGRVYAIGATGHLSCLDLASGAVVWGTNVVGAVPMDELEWGVSSSPLVHGDRVIVAPRGRAGVSLVALRADTGAWVWSGGESSAHYSSPRVETLLGVPQILTFTAAAAAAHDPRDGALLWAYAWRGGHPHVADPRAVDDRRVLISSGYGTGSHLVEIERGEGGTWSADRLVWRSIRLRSKFANVLLRGGYVYGLDDGRLVCVDLADGTRRWDGERYGHGQVLLVDEWILVTTESGEVALVEAKPEAFREVARFRALEGKTWNPPALAGDLLLVRNDREAAAFRIPLRP
ncbi:MAG: PQQ-like beta-propeller repeat protein [Verrucomicrobiae bacterium]|nr:PQQ-like beta-propeller repeat protein [Verrucomicrobiae bacterium]